MKKIARGVVVLTFLFMGALDLAAHKEAAPEKSMKTSEGTFKVQRGDRLIVSIDSGDISISSWNRDEVLVRAQGVNEEDNLTMLKEGNAVRVEFTSEWGSNHVRFNIQMPSQFDTDLHTSGGDIQFQGSFTGNLGGSTSGGDIILGDVGGVIRMDTSGGDIRVGRVTGDGFFETSGGDIEIQDVSSRAELSTSGGDIVIGNVGKTLKAHTAGGTIRIGDVGGEADVSTAGGDIQVGKVTGSATLRTAGGDIELRGATGMVRAKTAGGDLRLLKVSGSIIGETAGGDIHAELMPGGKGDSRLTTNGGDVILNLPENAKATIQARIRIRGHWDEMMNEYSIISDFPSKSYDKDSTKREIRATYILNGGGENISLETVNGDIQIRKLLQ
jgi:hypothetical protein